MTSTMIADVITKACNYLLRAQQPDGLWVDYELPVGRSDEWVSAFAGLALIEATNIGAINARPELTCAAIALTKRQRTTGGWGYNHFCKADTDSTSFVCQFFSHLGWGFDPISILFIEDHWQASAGCFSTYKGPLAWGSGHLDVTPYALLSISDEIKKKILPVFLGKLESHRDFGRGWKSYWWRNSLYSSLITLELLKKLECISIVLPFTDFKGYTSLDAFDIACLVGIAYYANWEKLIKQSYVSQLIVSQLPNGSWKGSPQLRVTDPGCYEPWVNPIGECYTDINSVITTSLAIRALIRQTNSDS